MYVTDTQAIAKPGGLFSVDHRIYLVMNQVADVVDEDALPSRTHLYGACLIWEVRRPAVPEDIFRSLGKKVKISVIDPRSALRFQPQEPSELRML